MKELKVYFGVCGIGLGHAGRCIPIAEKLIDQGAETLFSTYSDAVGFVAHKGLPVVEAPSVGFFVRSDGTVDFRQTVANPGPILASYTLTKQIESEIRFMRSFKPEVVVSDSRVSPLIAAKILGIPEVSILNQFQIIIPRRSRLLRLAKLVDTGALAIIGKLWTSGAAHVMIPDFPPPYVLSQGNLRIPESYQKRVKLIGPILPVNLRDLSSKKDLRKKLNLDCETPLIFLPMSGPIKERAYITGVLRKIIANTSSKFQIVMSLGYPNSHFKPFEKKNVRILGWIPNRFEYLKTCDLVISRAGHGTITQSICYGKPMILIPTPNHTEQLNNARRVEKWGLAEVFNQREINDKSFFSKVEKIIEDETYRKKAEEIRMKIPEQNGLVTAVETIKKITEKDLSES